MALSAEKMDMLKLLATKHLTYIDLQNDHNVRVVQELVGMGYARDFADHAGHRVQVRLRIWGITGAGKAVLEQQTMAEMTKGRQPSLTLFTKEPLNFPKKALKKPKEAEGKKEEKEEKREWDGEKWFQKNDGGLIPRDPQRLSPRDGIEKE